MKRAAAFLIVLGLVLLGCTVGTPRIEETRQVAAKKIAPGDAITIVGLAGVSGDVLSCIDGALRDSAPDLQVIPPIEFRETMFPWFEPNMAPQDTVALSRLLRRNSVRQRLDDMHLRYVVTIGGGTVGSASGWGGAAGGPYGAVVAGGVSWRRSTSLSAGILDLKRARVVAEIKAGAEGRGGMGFIILIPYFVPAATETITCKIIAKRVVAFVKGKSRPRVGG